MKSNRQTPNDWFFILWGSVIFSVWLVVGLIWVGIQTIFTCNDVDVRLIGASCAVGAFVGSIDMVLGGHLVLALVLLVTLATIMAGAGWVLGKAGLIDTPTRLVPFLPG